MSKNGAAMRAAKELTKSAELSTLLRKEKDFVLNSIKEHLANGTKLEDMAIICSTKYELQDMADVLTRNNIPSVMLNPTS